ncbi:MAG: hypothetical protein LCH35_06680 [Bacteroidetes bacterium]|jgi:prepilin signal peptidase PulO-like enzyme (type II secretory pathway)|uniref:hypothetical protein n=1 Tax=Flavobacterium sp. TaxID=239 RepID=UPI002FDB2350|nr:hypothetical protein [Bacteroidota bacterium]
MKIINIGFRIFRIFLIILFAAAAFNFEIKHDIPSYVVVGAVIVYVLSLILISVYEIIKKQIPDYIKVYAGLFTLIFNVIIFFTMFYNGERKIKSIFFAAIVCMILYGIWELSTIRKSKKATEIEA